MFVYDSVDILAQNRYFVKGLGQYYNLDLYTIVYTNINQNSLKQAIHISKIPHYIFVYNIVYKYYYFWINIFLC
jgi:hypothetical protein